MEEGLPFPRRGGRPSEALCGNEAKSMKKIEQVVCRRARSLTSIGVICEQSVLHQVIYRGMQG